MIIICAITGMLHIKIGRNKYTMGKNKEGKSLIFIYNHCLNYSYMCK